MTKDQLIERLLAIDGGYEDAHATADALLLEFIADDRVTEAWAKVGEVVR